VRSGLVRHVIGGVPPNLVHVEVRDSSVLRVTTFCNMATSSGHGIHGTATPRPSYCTPTRNGETPPMSALRRQQIYDHRLVQLVQRTGDIMHATGCGVPASTARGWLTRKTVDVITHPPASS
jgi:hypothetical protein